MNKQDFKLNNGYPLNQASLDRMQEAYSIFNALGAIVGDKSIISGCAQPIGSSVVSDGVVFVNGEVLDFKGGSAQTKVIIKEDTTNLVYKNNNSYPAVKTRYVTFGTGVGAMDWADFERGYETKEIATVFSDIANDLSTILTKLNTIDAYAKVQLQTDWNQNDNTKKDYLKNRPNIGSPFLAKGSYPIGNVSYNDDSRTITFPDIGTANYMVMGTIVSTGNQLYDNDVTFVIKGSSRTATGFVIVLADHKSTTQVKDLVFDYVLIAK